MAKNIARKPKYTTKKSEGKRASPEKPNAASAARGGSFSFPEEIILEILSRLPARSLLRFRSVCKKWQSVIDNPSFVDTHLARTRIRPGGGKLLFNFSNFDGSKHYFYSVGLGGGEAVRLLSLPGCSKGDTNPCKCYVSESIYGVLCFYNGTQVYVCNPTTRSIRSLPTISESERYSKSNDSFLNIPYSVFSFGFDEFSKEFKVLHIFGTHQRNQLRLYDLQCEIFVLKASSMVHQEFTSMDYSWRKITHVPPYPYMFRGQSVCVNSAIHWIGMMGPNQEILVAFDVGSEKFRLVSLPADCPLYLKSSLTKVRDCLALLCHDQDNGAFGLWVLEDYERLLWKKKTILVPSIQRPVKSHFCPVLVGTEYSGEMLLKLSTFSHHYDTICCDDKKNGAVKTIRVGGLPGWTEFHGAKNINFGIINHVESFMPLEEIVVKAVVKIGDFIIQLDG